MLRSVNIYKKRRYFVLKGNFIKILVGRLEGEILTERVKNDDRRNFGQTVREARRKKDIGLREFARKLGIDYSRLSRIERGKRPPPELEIVIKMAKILEISKNKLLRLVGVPEEVVSEFEADIGNESWITGRVSGKKGELTIVDTGKWKLRIVEEPTEERVLLGLRPKDITLFSKDDSFSDTSARNQIEGEITDINPKENYNLVELNCDNFTLTVAITDTSLSKLDLRVGKKVYATFKATAPKIKKANEQ